MTTDELKEKAKRVLSAVSLTDLHTYGGLGLVGVGGELIYSGLGFVAAGSALFWLANRKVTR